MSKELYSDFFDKAKFAYRESSNQSNLFTPHHTKYVVSIEYNNNKITFNYQCNPKYCEPSLEDCMYSYITDCIAYEECGGDLAYFNQILYFDNEKDCKRTFNLCRQSFNKIVSLFGRDVYEKLKKHYEDY